MFYTLGYKHEDVFNMSIINGLTRA